MIRFQLDKVCLLLGLLSSLPVMGDDDIDNAMLIRSDSTGVAPVDIKQRDSARIYPDQGAIWASRDMFRFDPVLNVTVNDAIEVNKEWLKNPVNFSVTTNYSYYIDRWQLEIYRNNDVYYSQPLALISGKGLTNNTSISWQGETTSPFTFKPGKQILYRLKVWDKQGNLDITTTGVTDLVSGQSKARQAKLDNEYGMTFGRARLMRHNIPTTSGMVKFIGSGLTSITKVSIGGNEYSINHGRLYAEQYLPADSYVFPVILYYKNRKEQHDEIHVSVPNSYFTQIGIADLTIGKNFVSGNQDILSTSYQYQNDIYNQGRLAYFAEGKFGDKLSVIANVDTWQHEIKNMFKQPFASRERTVFDILDDDDPELFYGEYGDHAYIQKVVNTKGKVFLNVEYDKSALLWGNYNTGITGSETASYNRSLYGFKVDLRSRSTTEYGDDYAMFTGFAAEADTAFAHDEFMGTGTSVYFLRHGELVPGSDKIYIRQIDVQTLQVVAQIALRPGIDYDVDPFQGRIILTKPLSSRALLNNQPVINNLPGGDIYNYLVVDYEYLPASGKRLDNMTYGGRFKGWLNKHIGLGTTYIKEDKDQQNYQLKGTDLTLRFTEGSYLKAEFSESKGIQTQSNFMSTDGGLTFTAIDAAKNDRSGHMLLINGQFNFYDMLPSIVGAVGNDFGFWYKNKEAGFSYASQYDDLAQESWGAKLRLQLSERLQWVTRYQDTEQTNVKGEQVTDSKETGIELGWLASNHIKLSVAGERINELDSNKKNSDGSLVGARIDYIFDASNLIFIKGQKTIERSKNYADNDSVTLGMEAKLVKNMAIAGDYTAGDRGNTSQLTLGYDRSNTHNTYMTWVNDQYEGKNNLVFGQKGRLTDKLSAFQENQFVDENNGKGRIDSFGFDYRAFENVNGGFSFQQGKIHEGIEETRRTAGSMFYTLDRQWIYLANKIEVRVDKGSERIEQIVTINRYIQQFNSAYTFYGKFNLSRSNNSTINKTIQRFIEGSVGLAYRPVFNDRWNLLSRYTYLVDVDKRKGIPEPKNEKSHIVEAETIFDLNAHFDLGSKIAWKKREDSFWREDGDRLMINNNIYLLALSGSYHVMKNWDLTAEYHWKVDKERDNVAQGSLVSVNKLLGNNFKLGVGYNFSRFTDDLIHRDNYDAKGFFINMLGVF